MSKFNIPKINKQVLFISKKIKILNNDLYHKVIAIDSININELLIEEYPIINLFGDKNIDKALQIMQKYIITKEQQLYPRNNNYTKTVMIKNIHKIIKNSPRKIQQFFDNYNKDIVEFYYAKYLYNCFEGYDYGPLTLPTIAKLNHSCNNNVDFNFNKLTGTMIVTSNRYIKKGEEIFDNYLLNKDILDHKKYLYEHYGFICDC